MDNNIYDLANQLAQELRESSLLKNVQTALTEIEADEEANALFTRFQEMSQQVQSQDLDDEAHKNLVNEIQTVYGEVISNPIIGKLMQGEQQLSTVMNDINRIIAQPINDLYQNSAE